MVEQRSPKPLVAGSNPATPAKGVTKMLLGLVLIAVGALALLMKLGIISGSLWGYAWPVILILIGLSFLWGRHRMWVWRRHWWPQDDDTKQ